MRLTRLLATALTVLGVGLVSGAVAQVAALDGSLERAAAEAKQTQRSHPACGHRDPAYRPKLPSEET